MDIGEVKPSRKPVHKTKHSLVLMFGLAEDGRLAGAGAVAVDAVDG
jgi:hypothetical protein